MSKERKITWQCEHCKKEFEVNIFDSVNVSLDPELREKVLTGNIFMHKCPHCNNNNIIQHPILYHDMKNKFMIQLGPLRTIYGFKRFYKEEFNANCKEKLGFEIKSFDDYKFYGATTWGDLKSTIVALENSLDIKVVLLHQAILIFNYLDYAEKNNKPQYLDSHFGYNEKGELTFFIEVGNNNEYEGTFNEAFNKEIYDSLEEEYGDYLYYMDGFNFNLKSAIKFLNYSDEELIEAEHLVRKCYFVEVRDGSDDIVYSLDFNEDKFNIGDYVIIEDTQNGWTYEARIFHIEEMTELDLPTEYSNMRRLLWKNDGMELVTTGDSDDELDNEDLSEKLIKWNESKKNFPNTDISESDIIVGLVATLSDKFLRSISDIEELKVDMEIKPDDMKTSLATIKNDKGEFLKVYLDHNDIRKYKEESPMIYNFNDIINYVLRCPSLYDGIMVYTEDKEILIPIPYLLNVYIPDRVLTNSKRLISVLEKLNDKEKEFVKAFNYKVICKVYFEGKNPNQISEELHLDTKKIGKALSDGYGNLKTIIKANY